jgi:hypothetical protein
MLSSAARGFSGLFIPAVCSHAADPPGFSTGVTLVHVDAQVLRHDGVVVSGLVQSDFRVFDEGVEQKVVAFARDQEPLDLVLLEDIRGMPGKS